MPLFLKRHNGKLGRVLVKKKTLGGEGSLGPELPTFEMGNQVPVSALAHYSVILGTSLNIHVPTIKTCSMYLVLGFNTAADLVGN